MWTSYFNTFFLFLEVYDLSYYSDISLRIYYELLSLIPFWWFSLEYVDGIGILNYVSGTNLFDSSR